MMDEDCVLLTQSTIIRNLSRKQYEVLMDLCLKNNDLRNCAVEKTRLYFDDDEIHYRKIDYKQIISSVKSEFNNQYVLVQAHIANATIKKHVESFNSYVELLNKKIDGKYEKDVNPPKKHENKLHNIIILRESITSSKKKLKKDYIYLPLSRKYNKRLSDKDSRPKIKIPENIRDKKIIQVEIIPIGGGRMFKANFTYEVEKEPLGLDENKVMGIDLVC